MNVLGLTLLVSACLAGLFIVCFAIEVRRNRRSSPERDSLLPLDSMPPSGVSGRVAAPAPDTIPP